MKNNQAFLAIESGDMARLMMALMRGENINCRNDYGKTPLIAACANPNSRQGFVRYLIENNANANLSDQDGNTALHCVCLNPDFDKTNFELILEQGVALNQQNNEGQAPLHILAQRNRMNACIELMDFVSRPGDLINQTDNQGRTPLWYASKHPALTCILISYGADPRIVDREGTGPIELTEDVETRIIMSNYAQSLNKADEEKKKASEVFEKDFADLIAHGKAILAKDYLTNDALKFNSVNIPDSQTNSFTSIIQP